MQEPNFDTRAVAISGDGSTIVGYSEIDEPNTTRTYERAVSWGLDGQINRLFAETLQQPQGVAGAVNFDGSVIGGTINGVFAGGVTDAFVYRESTGPVLLGAGQDEYFGTNVTAMSSDGTTFAGRVRAVQQYTPLIWTDGGATVRQIDGFEDVASLSVEAMSADGSTIAGTWNKNGGLQRGFIWSETTGRVDLGIDTPTTFSGHLFKDMSDDGKTFLLDFPMTGPTLYSEAEGLRVLEVPDAFETAEVLSMSGDGSVVVGYVRAGSERTQGYWVDGNFNLFSDALAANGLTVGEFDIDFLVDVADDGRTFVGYGELDDGQERGFVAVIPEPALLSAVVIGGLCLLRRRLT
ncbi:MAG: hypothetical protein AAGK78_02645 [Planctomycetota bacterium]